MESYNRIVIYVVDGIVQDVYSEDPNVFVEVIDRDTDSHETEAQIELELKELRKDLRKMRLTPVW